jgi:hypothetical protein
VCLNVQAHDSVYDSVYDHVHVHVHVHDDPSLATDALRQPQSRSSLRAESV